MVERYVKSYASQKDLKSDFSQHGWMTESSRNWKEKQMQKRTSSNLISSVLDRIRKWSRIKRNERNKNHKNLFNWLITGSVKKSSLPVTEMPKLIQINFIQKEWVKLIEKNSAKCSTNSKRAKSLILVSGKDLWSMDGLRDENTRVFVFVRVQ